MSRSAQRSLLVVAALTALGVGAAPAVAWAGKAKTTADRTAPTVAISSPAAGATVSPSFTVTGTAGDNVGVTKVVVAVDAGSPATATGTTSWSWATPTLAAGSHTLRATAYDGAGNTTSTSVTVTVSTPDTTAPTVTISAPTSGSTVSGTIQVTGTAADNTAVSSVQVKVDAGALQPASGTSSWSLGLDTTSWSSGTHTVTAQAYDTAGNVATTTTTVSVAATASTTTTSGSDIALADPKATNGLQLVGRGRAAEWGSVSALLYSEDFTARKAAVFRDSATGTTSYVDLPTPDSSGWALASYTMTSATDLWVFGGGGPVVLRHYGLSGGTVPTSATLLSSQTLGDSDSRTGDLTKLASGALVAAWHQQGATGPQGQWVAYVPASGGATQVLGPYTMGVTKASKQVVAQHPADGSVWLFSEADATGTVVTATFTEAGRALSLRSTDAAFLNTTKYGDNGPDPENPDLAVSADPSTGTLALAYQDAHRTMFQTSPTVTGSWVTVAHVPASGSPTFTVLPVWVERISSLALVVQPGSTWLAYRPIDTSTMTFDHLAWSVYRSGAWSTQSALGQLYSSYERLTYGISRPEVTTRMADGRLHLFTLA